VKDIHVVFSMTSLGSSVAGDTDLILRTSTPTGESLDLEMAPDEHVRTSAHTRRLEAWRPRAKISRENARLLGLALLEWAGGLEITVDPR
jgi:hypothetical protein